VKATWILFGGPCAGTYDAESSWPPPERIRAVHDGNGNTAVLDRGECAEPDEHVVEYEISSWGYVCSRGRNTPNAAHVVYFLAGLTEAARHRAAGIAAGVAR
jgi:hypothetical protein